MQDEDLSFTALFESNFTFTRSIAYRNLLKKADAEDVALEVFAALAVRLPHLCPDSNIRAYLAVAARNRARAWNRREVAATGLEVEPEEARPVVEARLYARELLRQLPPAQALAVYGNLALGLSCEEIAAMSRTPLGSVKSRLRRGLQKLRGGGRQTDRQTDREQGVVAGLGRLPREKYHEAVHPREPLAAFHI